MTTLPPITVLFGPSGAGKTRQALQRFVNSPSNTVLVATSQAQAGWLARKATEEGGVDAAIAESRIVTFNRLVAEVIKQEPDVVRASCGHTFQRILLSTIISDTVGADDYLGKMLYTPGFISALQDAIREWKLAGATPETFETAGQAALATGIAVLDRKLRDMGRLYDAYERFLNDARLHDDEDSLKRASELIRSGQASIPWNARQIIVHGFYAFTPAHRAMLGAFAENEDVEIVVTLPWEERRPFLFAAPFRTLTKLRREFTTHEIALSDPERGERRRTWQIRALSDRLFDEGEPAAAPLTLESEADRPIRVLDAPNAYVEAEMVAREFLVIRGSRNIPWNEFGVVTRSLGDYAAILTAVFERYGIPIPSSSAETCASNPLLRTVMKYLDVVRYGWRREEVISFLKSSYTAPGSLVVEHLRRHAIKSAVRAGKEAWLAAARSGAFEAHLDFPLELAQLQKTISEMARIDEVLAGQTRPAADFVATIRETIVAFGLEDRMGNGEPYRLERDRSAVIQGLNALNGLARISSVRQSGAISFREFHRLLQDAWENTGVSPSLDGVGVRLMEPREARDSRLRVCAIMGLTERVFPRRISEDPFLRDEERRLVREWTSVDLEEHSLHVDDERYLFYMAATVPSDHLILSFPRSTNEKDTLPSFFIDNVRAVFESGPLADSPPPSQTEVLGLDRKYSAGVETCVRTLGDVASDSVPAASESDALLSACSELFNVQAANIRREGETLDAAKRIRALMEAPGRAIPIAAALRSRHLPALPVLSQQDTKLDFAGAKSTYTVVELETYAQCPFRYLLRHVWNVRTESEGLDRARRSALVHTVLRKYFRERSQRTDKPDVSLDPEAVFLDLNRHLLESLQSARLDPEDHRIRIQLQRLSEDLMGFAIREVRCAAQFGTNPAYVHLTFGRAPVAVAPDPYSSSAPLVLTGPEGSVAISGSIDRLDLDETGQRAIIVEYETGHPPEFAAIIRGASLQMPINLMAVERLFGLDAAAACYDSLLEQGRRRFHRTEHVNMRQYAPALPFDDPTNVKPLSREQFKELIATAEATAVRLARSIEEGSIAAAPGPHCAGCEFSDICRTTLTEGHDGERKPNS